MEKPMASKKFWLGILTMVLVFGMTVVCCDNDPTNEKIEKSLAITNITPEGGHAVQVGIFPTGTDSMQAINRDNIVAGRDGLTLEGISAPYSITIALLSAPFFISSWSGSGTYDVYLILGHNKLHHKENVSFTSSLTTVDFGEFVYMLEIFD